MSDYERITASYEDIPAATSQDDNARNAIEGNQPSSAQAEAVNDEAAQNISQEAGLDIEAIETHWLEHGSVPESELAKLAPLGITPEMVNEFVNYRYEQAQHANNELLTSFGGQETVSQMQHWAAQHWDDAQLAAFNKAVDSQDMGQIQLAMKALKAEYGAANPPAPPKPKFVAAPNKTVGQSLRPYDSLAEAQQDFQNPAYHKDPAFRDKVAKRLSLSRL